MNTPVSPTTTSAGPQYTAGDTGKDPSEPLLLDQVRAQIHLRHYSIRTEAQYVQWVKRFVLFHQKRYPREMGAAEVEVFLTPLAVEGHVASATQNQALSALLFLYRQVLGVELPWLDGVVRAKRPERLPVVLTRSEVQRGLERMDGVYGLLARLLYGTGMRLMEVIRLRVKDVDFAKRPWLGQAPRLMKAMTVSLTPSPLPQAGEGRFVSRWRDFHSKEGF